MEAAFGYRHGRLARPGPDLKDAISGPEVAEFYEVIKQFRWVARARAVVELSGLVERRTESSYFIPLVAAPPTKYFWPAT